MVTHQKATEFKHCPLCGSDNLSRKKVKRSKVKGNKVVTAIFDMWECGDCNEGFFNTWTLAETNSELTLKEPVTP